MLCPTKQGLGLIKDFPELRAAAAVAHTLSAAKVRPGVVLMEKCSGELRGRNPVHHNPCNTLHFDCAYPDPGPCELLVGVSVDLQPKARTGHAKLHETKRNLPQQASVAEM